ncbi:alanine/glycine:cation symporter family protein [Ferrimonas pelagia]|uniref:Alanine/glycine:cation symporter family protein n=1 Tax=Ferrimonas pelagia TaxID=1177826 RepID=A0ABP9EWJ8_9GAMM
MTANSATIRTLWPIWALVILTSPGAAAATFDQQVEALVAPWAQALTNLIFYAIPLFGHSVPLIVLWLAIAALFFTLYLGFINLRGFVAAVRLVKGDYRDSKAQSSGEISHFQALATAVSGTVGIGNIGGVAVAIGIGGPGAAFWLFMAGFLSMSTKLVECTLGVKYRQVHADGSVSGGPMYYLEHALVNRGWVKAGKALGGFYALALVIGCLGIGNMFQSNQAFMQFQVISGGDASWFADKGWLFGLILAAGVALVIIGGIKSIARITAKIVPFMAVLYIVSATAILALGYEQLPGAIALIISEAFTMDSATGGLIGAMIVGFQRALFSNEAGIGSASIAHSAVQTDKPASEGLVALLEPFIDTMVICTLSALVIVTTAYPAGLMESGLEGIELTSAAFAHHISWAPYPLALAAMLFAFSTTLSWSYYGLKGWTYLFGQGPAMQMVFKGIFCSFIALGCMVQLKAVLDFSDAMVFLIAIPNILGLYLLAPEVKREVEGYLAELKGRRAAAQEPQGVAIGDR